MVYFQGTQCPPAKWGTEGLPFNDLPESPYDSWDIVEGLAGRLGVAMQSEGDHIYLLKGPGEAGKFTNTTIGIEQALKFLGGIKSG